MKKIITISILALVMLMGCKQTNQVDTKLRIVEDSIKYVKLETNFVNYKIHIKDSLNKEMINQIALNNHYADVMRSAYKAIKERDAELTKYSNYINSLNYKLAELK